VTILFTVSAATLQRAGEMPVVTQDEDFDALKGVADLAIIRV
jgi:hypothetical protein